MISGLARPAEGNVCLFGQNSHDTVYAQNQVGILIENPELVLSDEPVNGLDPQGMAEIREIITKLNKDKSITFIISSHILGELSKIATCYGIIEKADYESRNYDNRRKNQIY